MDQKQKNPINEVKNAALQLGGAVLGYLRGSVAKFGSWAECRRFEGTYEEVRDGKCWLKVGQCWRGWQ